MKIRYVLVLFFIFSIFIIQFRAGAGNKDSFNILDGKTFVGPIGEKGKRPDHDDMVIFSDGTFVSEGCKKHGFSPGTYTAFQEKNSIRFRAEITSSSYGTMLWEGLVEGDSIEANITWTRKRWYWKIRQEYVFSGQLKK